MKVREWNFVSEPVVNGASRTVHGNVAIALRRSNPILASMSSLTVWHDGSCPLCRREIALMRRLDRNNAILFVDAATASEDACPLDRAVLLSRFHASENGRLLSGAAAFAAMWRVIPLLRPLGLAARLPGMLPVLEWLYLAFLKHRPRLQRLCTRRSAA